MSPDGSTIVTGAGDETLRFWNIFPNRNEESKTISSILNTDSVMLR
jgi:cell division cycle 20-like protein 1 (cofactor of APC complex)